MISFLLRIMTRVVPLVSAVAATAAVAQLASYGKSELTIETASGKQHFSIEEARTPEQMAQGLMFRRSLPADAGMLFEYEHPQPTSFWMKNTLIPLDMLFIAADGTVIGVHERAVPLSLEPITSQAPVLAVLELNGGTAARLGIKPSQIDNTLYDAFGQRFVSTMYTQLNQYHVVLEVAPEFRRNPSGLSDIYIHSSNGTEVPLS
ncbi:MAG: DUF192 domain-containing protein, partial [Alphaproteobacteria bacterium]|nr:DUF192 domain-containing protein [Alphaproteobacteria bacterium]